MINKTLGIKSILNTLQSLLAAHLVQLQAVPKFFVLLPQKVELIIVDQLQLAMNPVGSDQSVLLGTAVFMASLQFLSQALVFPVLLIDALLQLQNLLDQHPLIAINALVLDLLELFLQTTHWAHSIRLVEADQFLLLVQDLLLHELKLHVLLGDQLMQVLYFLGQQLVITAQLLHLLF